MISLPGYTLSTILHEGLSTLIIQGHRDADQMPIVAKLSRSELPRPREVARRRHEYSILKHLDVPGVVKAHALETHSQGPALILEGIKARPLNELIRAGTLDLSEILRIAVRLAEILAGIYKQRVIHKDIKPANILIEEGTGSVYLIDFGVASLLSQEALQATAPHALEGTLAYMSPEQSGRINRVIDHRTDFYSLGVTLYEMLVGALPFESTDPVELVHQHIAQRPVPSHERNPQIPRQLSDLVMKLLAKAAEDRYQNPNGLVADLKECRDQWLRSGKIEPFSLGRYDISDVLQVSQKLYGRQRELTQLLESIERVNVGRSELLLVGGSAGVGKSALIYEMTQAIAQRGGEFVTGKFDQLHRTLPFAAFTQAFRDLVGHLLTLPTARLADWQQRLKAALGVNAQLLIELIPELELVIGAQPPVAILGPTESQLRFGMVIQNFVRVFTQAHMVVLFIDDLQWADPASLGLLHMLLTDVEGGRLLIIGAYRDNEVDVAHPLRTALQGLQKQGVTPTELQLEPLVVNDVQQLLSDTFGAHAGGSIDSLAAQVFKKTLGNPFFLIQFLGALHKAGLLYLDTATNKWMWDESRVASAPIADNVVEFMTAQLRTLPVDTQHLLALAACIGYQFELSTLTAISDQQPQQISAALWPAMTAGLLVPLTPDYRLLSGPAAADPALQLQYQELKVAYRFLHDRVQQAAYSLITAAQRPEIHLRIGRMWLAQLSSTPRADALFDVVHHLNAGQAEIQDPAERLGLAQLNLQAGRTAKAATAFMAAADFVVAGLRQLDAGAWENNYDLAYQLNLEQAECEYLVGHFDKADAQIGALLGHARTNLEKTELLGMRMALYASHGRFPEGIAEGRAGLKLLGIDLPEDPQACLNALMADVASIGTILQGISIQSLVDAPLITDKVQQSALRMMMDLTPLAFQIDPVLCSLIVAKQVLISLTHGNTSASAYAYVTYGLILAGSFGQYAAAIELGRLALQLVEKLGAAEVACKVNSVYAFFAPYGEPMRQSISVCARAQQIGLETGDLYYASMGFIYLPLAMLRLGDPLESVREELVRGLSAMKRTKDQTATHAITLMQAFIACLQGQTEGPTSLDSADFSEAAWLERVQRLKIGGIKCLFYCLKSLLFTLYENSAQALAMAVEAEINQTTATGLHYVTDVAFLAALALAREYESATADKQPALREVLERHLASLTRYKEGAPTNEEHRHALICAELARISDQFEQAQGHYEKAITTARENGFPHHEALAHELYGKMLLRRGDVKAAAQHMTKACYGYERWGATAKVAQLSAAYPRLLASPDALPTLREGPSLTDTTTTVWMSSQSLDSVSILRASQAISSEIVLDKVLDRVMRVVLASAGAQRGFLVLERDHTLFVTALLAVDPVRVEVGLHTPVDERTDLAASIIHYVARRHETVVLADASAASRFAADPYIVSSRPKSILCLALLHQGRLAGILYLENNVSTNVFTHERVEILRLISSQAAISMENAQLYSNLQIATEKLRQSNENLEQQVAARTAELSKALADLWSEMDLARKIQTVLLPTDARIPGYELTALMRPASTVGGDYYDIFHEGGSDWMLIGDVSGHGVTAGLYMMMVQTAVRAVTRTLQRKANSLQPSDVLTIVNSALHRNFSQIGRDHYMTISALCFKDGTIRYAGLHQDLLVYRAATQKVERFETRGVWLGLMPDVDGKLEEDQLQMAENDVLLLFTDGATEASLGKRKYLYTKGLAAMLQAIAPAAGSTATIIEQILEQLKGYTINDDITLIAVRRLPVER